MASSVPSLNSRNGKALHVKQDSDMSIVAMGPQSCVQGVHMHYNISPLSSMHIERVFNVTVDDFTP